MRGVDRRGDYLVHYKHSRFLPSSSVFSALVVLQFRFLTDICFNEVRGTQINYRAGHLRPNSKQRGRAGRALSRHAARPPRCVCRSGKTRLIYSSENEKG
ncbi:hypothetical protein KP509_02G104800 [Ceratopteris richardii]|uniref:Uncharacterized protein n=1 Tax=Ceratopteris richardii TaxID=49495 RepID=A0A8T2VGS6_CERRI|nr:hypothetical protein KP509_02G104800 [Ceratopteris richardii]